MRKVWVVIRREFVERIRRRWFWVMALLGPLFFAAVFVLPTVLASRGGVRQIVVVDATTGPVGARITHLLNDSPMFRARRVPASGKVVDSLTTEVEQKRLAGFLIVTDAAADSGKAEYRGSNASGFATVGALERTIGDVVSAVRLEREGVDPRVVARARIPVRIDTKKIAGGKTTGETAAQSFSLAYFMGIILYTAILLYGINVMSSVLEEKTTRIVEVLVSSLRPFQLMLGKVLGVGAVSILQFLIWGVSARLLFAHRPGFLTGGDVGEADQIFQVPHVSGATAAVFITYFLGGFFLYSAARAVVREHVRHAERSRVRLCGHAVARPVQLPDRDAGALGRRKPADLRVGAVARNPRRVDCRGHVDRGAHIPSGNTHDGEAAEHQGTHTLDTYGLGRA